MAVHLLTHIIKGSSNRFHSHLLQAVARGEFTITGLRHKDLQRHLPGRNPAWISRSLKRLRVHGLIKRVGKTYKHYLTDLGKRAILGGLKVIEMSLVPALAAPPSPA